jgi:hypothetical protein
MRKLRGKTETLNDYEQKVFRKVDVFESYLKNKDFKNDFDE